MDFQRLVVNLERNADRIGLFVEGVSMDQSHWKPDPESWSIVEVINHLYDEERLDFRVRLNLILYHPEQDWPPIDPKGWVEARKYNERELVVSWQDFLKERKASLVWLKGLDRPNWEAACQAPWGIMKAGDMFAAWASHDLLHMRQLVELLRAYTVQLAGSYQVEYAGPW